MDIIVEKIVFDVVEFSPPSLRLDSAEAPDDVRRGDLIADFPSRSNDFALSLVEIGDEIGVRLVESEAPTATAFMVSMTPLLAVEQPLLLPDNSTRPT